jgi:excinuclease ABC subunit C
LSAAAAVLKREGFEELELISLAKRFETVYSERRGGEVTIPRDSPALHLLQKVRDEAHRFAIQYHRSLKEKGQIRSALDEIPGIGEKRKRILLEQFDSLEILARSGRDQLAGLPGMNREVAGKVLAFFRNSNL